MIVFIPLGRSELAELRHGSPVTATGYAAGAALRDAYGVADAEEADFIASMHAEAVAVTKAEPSRGRVVVAAEIADESCRWTTPPDELGSVHVDRLTWDQVIAVYLDEDAAVARVDEVAAVVGALDPAAAVDHRDIRALVEDHDLLWHLPAEVDSD